MAENYIGRAGSPLETAALDNLFLVFFTKVPLFTNDLDGVSIENLIRDQFVILPTRNELRVSFTAATRTLSPPSLLT